MVTIRLTDCRTLTGRFETLLPLVDAERRERVKRRGCDTAAGRQCLGAGLLLCQAFGREKCQGIRLGSQGKPYLPGERAFSLSHTGDFAVLALADAPVGVDMERERGKNVNRVAERFFHPAERAWMANAPDPETAFLTIWTLKESYLKAEGCGFARPLSAFCILPEGVYGAEMPGESGYRFRRYPAPEGYAVAVCSLDGGFPLEIERVVL